MNSTAFFYICTVCFKTSEDEEVCHTLMLPVRPGEPGDEMRKPIERDGRLQTHAPRWFLEGKKDQISD